MILLEIYFYGALFTLALQMVLYVWTCRHEFTLAEIAGIVMVFTAAWPLTLWLFARETWRDMRIRKEERSARRARRALELYDTPPTRETSE